MPKSKISNLKAKFEQADNVSDEVPRARFPKSPAFNKKKTSPLSNVVNDPLKPNAPTSSTTLMAPSTIPPRSKSPSHPEAGPSRPPRETPSSMPSKPKSGPPSSMPSKPTSGPPSSMPSKPTSGSPSSMPSKPTSGPPSSMPSKPKSGPPSSMPSKPSFGPPRNHKPSANDQTTQKNSLALPKVRGRKISGSSDIEGAKSVNIEDARSDIEDDKSGIEDVQSDVEMGSDDGQVKSSVAARTNKRRTTKKMKKKRPRPQPPANVPQRKATYTKTDEVVGRNIGDPGNPNLPPRPGSGDYEFGPKLAQAPPPIPVRTDIQQSTPKPVSPRPRARTDIQQSTPQPVSSRARSKSTAGPMRKSNLTPNQDAKMQRKTSEDRRVSQDRRVSAEFTRSPPPITSAPPPLHSAPPQMPKAKTLPRLPKSKPPSTLPPPAAHARSKSPGRTLSVAEDSLLGLDDDNSEYEDDDDIYGQISAIDLDFDDPDYDPGADFIVVQKPPAPVVQQLNKSGFREYWHERKEVVDSGILEGEQIGKTERARQEAMYEIYTSEQTYRKSMETLEKEFLNDNLFACFLEPDSDDEDEDAPGPDLADIVLGNIHDVIGVSKRFVEELRNLYEGQITIESVTGLLKSFVDHQFSAYITYCSNTSLQQEILTNKRKSDPGFNMFLEGKERTLMGQNLQSFLIQPMQRICRMPILLDAVLKKTEEDNPDREALEAIYKEVRTIVQTCNEEARKSEVRRDMGELQKRCDFTKIETILTSFTDKQERLIIKESVVLKLNFKGGKVQGTKIRLWLFTDCLVIGASLDPKDESKITLTEHCPRQLIKVVEHFTPPRNVVKKKVPSENIFHLQLTSPGTTANSKIGKHIIQCHTPKEKDNWIEVLKPTAKETENEDETIYEEWDVPLVKAQHHYQGSGNTDDLELYEGEVCRVLKKYTDGWCFGVRERDGQKGWFPMSFMVEIESDHARYREIKRKQELVESLANNAEVAGVFGSFNTLTS